MPILNERKNHREQPVEVQEKRFGYFPKTFRWQGKRYNVEAVEKCWSRGFAAWDRAIPTDDPTPRNRVTTRGVPRLYFRVRCRDRIFDLYQDLRANTWHLRNP